MCLISFSHQLQYLSTTLRWDLFVLNIYLYVSTFLSLLSITTHAEERWGCLRGSPYIWSDVPESRDQRLSYLNGLLEYFYVDRPKWSPVHLVPDSNPVSTTRLGFKGPVGTTSRPPLVSEYPKKSSVSLRRHLWRVLPTQSLRCVTSM